ncbi:MAG: DUF448 domain-containing protein, partial [Alphaproteobacteria bacterium]|nr:DUF448 domain-containing protein [Alphaproteobacteria bacterium]
IGLKTKEKIWMKTNNPNRTCLMTGEEKPQNMLLRFTLTPDRQVIPDFKKKLEGKGFYISNSKQILSEAITKNVFRKFGKNTSVVPNLLEIVENILKNKALDSINLANKAGDLVCGLDKVKEKLANNQVAFLLQATNAGTDGKNKMQSAAKDIKILTLFSSEELDKALNKVNTVHLAILKGPMSQNVYNQLQKWQDFINS